MSHRNAAKHVRRDTAALRELELYIDNTEPLYRQAQAIQQNLIRKIQSGRYDHRRAPKLWLYLVDEGARRYVKEFGGDVRTMFPLPVRRHLAKIYAAHFIRQLRSGEVKATIHRNVTMTRVLGVNAISPTVPMWMR